MFKSWGVVALMRPTNQPVGGTESVDDFRCRGEEADDARGRWSGGVGHGGPKREARVPEAAEPGGVRLRWRQELDMLAGVVSPGRSEGTVIGFARANGSVDLEGGAGVEA